MPRILSEDRYKFPEHLVSKNPAFLQRFPLFRFSLEQHKNLMHVKLQQVDIGESWTFNIVWPARPDGAVD